MSATVPVSVVVPTIGRSGTLTGCLESIIACDPAPAEVVVVDQSGSDVVRSTIDALGHPGVRRVVDPGRGIARATNAGLRAATNDIVLRTDDDCTVAPDWAGIAWRHLADHGDVLLTGQVRAGGDPDRTPSIIVDPDPVDRGPEQPGFYLHAGNMAVSRERALALGGFDERPTLLVAAEDNDFSWRWMRAGGTVRYAPELVVWHHDWRSDRQLRARYRAYARGHGALYGKHLRGGDPTIRDHLVYDLRMSARAWRASLRRPGRLAAPDELRSYLPHLVLGVLSGWREAARLDGPRRTS